MVAREERVPVRAPEQLDHVPAGALEHRLEFVDDAPVAAHRAVQPLQVAVDDEDEVVQPLARRQAQPGERLGLVHLAVAEEAPDSSVAHLGEAAVLQVAHEARLIDRRQRADAHRAGRELPEVGHQPGVRVRGQAAHARAAAARLGGSDLLPVVREVVFEPPLEEGARIHARRRVRLEEDEVAPSALSLRARKKWLKPTSNRSAAEA